MRVLLLHNPAAGGEEHGKESLLEALQQAGHETIYHLPEKGWKKALKRKPDLVLIAGGDGTVGEVAAKLVGRKLPLSVLPLGTANNLARTLGFDEPVKKLIARLGRGKSVGFDVGRARGPWGKRDFFEGLGAGLFAEYLYEQKQAKKPRKKESKAEEMKRHVRELRRRLQEEAAQRWEIELDGEDFSGRYLLWQAMNIRSVGPVLPLAPAARTDDGRFEFIGAREKDRAVLLDHLKARLAGQKAKFPLPTRKFRRMRLRWKKAPLHIDDDLWPEKGAHRLKRCEAQIEVRESALRVWRGR